MNAIVPILAGSLPIPASPLVSAKRYAAASKAASTKRAYATDARIFAMWCEAHGLVPLPATPETVAAFVAAQADDAASYSVGTISRRIAAIRYMHRLAGFEPPTSAESVKATMAGIRRELCPSRPRRRKAPATAERVRAMVAGVPADTLAGLRDRALILLGFAGAFRRAELVALRIEDLDETAEGFRVTIRSSKTDQDGEGQTIAVVRGSVACPVAAVRAWLDAAGIVEGPVFRSVAKGGRVGASLSDCMVARLVKRYAEAAGLDPRAFAGHSLRAGFLTSAAGRGASIFKMMDISRHRSVDTLRGYVREAEIFRDHAGAGLL